jgi:hypothetical protein
MHTCLMVHIHKLTQSEDHLWIGLFMLEREDVMHLSWLPPIVGFTLIMTFLSLDGQASARSRRYATGRTNGYGKRRCECSANMKD